MTTDTPRRHRRTKKRVLVTGFTAFLVIVLCLAVFFYQNFKTVEVQGPSMEPTLYTGQRLLVTKAYWLVGSIHKGDIIVLQNPDDGDVLIKRVYAMSGQNVDDHLAPISWNFSNGSYKVPSDSIYVLGDNKAKSEDSRQLGSFKMEDILGKVVVLGTPGNVEPE